MRDSHGSREHNSQRSLRDSHGFISTDGSGLQEEGIQAFCNQAQLERKRLMEASTLLVAAQSGSALIMRFLIASRIDVATRSDQGKTALHIAAKKGHVECVQLLLEAGADSEVKDANGNSAIHDAASAGEDAVVKALIKKGADFSTENWDGYSALHVAASEGFFSHNTQVRRH